MSNIQQQGNKSMLQAIDKEMERSVSKTLVEIIEYAPQSIVIQTIIKKSTGIISIMAFDKGEKMPEKISPFDSFAQVLEGEAEIIINKKSHLMEGGRAIIIPAHVTQEIRANTPVKMLLTVIKSGYEN